MDLKAAFREGTQVPLTLQFRDGKGQARQLKVSLPVSRELPHAHK